MAATHPFPLSNSTWEDQCIARVKPTCTSRPLPISPSCNVQYTVSHWLLSAVSSYHNLQVTVQYLRFFKLSGFVGKCRQPDQFKAGFSSLCTLNIRTFLYMQVLCIYFIVREVAEPKKKKTALRLATILSLGSYMSSV